MRIWECPNCNKLTKITYERTVYNCSFCDYSTAYPAIITCVRHDQAERDEQAMLDAWDDEEITSR